MVLIVVAVRACLRVGATAHLLKTLRHLTGASLQDGGDPIFAWGYSIFDLYIGLRIWGCLASIFSWLCGKDSQFLVTRRGDSFNFGHHFVLRAMEGRSASTCVYFDFRFSLLQIRIQPSAYSFGHHFVLLALFTGA